MLSELYPLRSALDSVVSKSTASDFFVPLAENEVLPR